VRGGGDRVGDSRVSSCGVLTSIISAAFIRDNMSKFKRARARATSIRRFRFLDNL